MKIKSDKPFSSIAMYVPSYELGITDIQQVIKHNNNMLRVMNNTDYRECAEGEMYHIVIEQKRCEKFLNDVSILTLIK